jgi:hypothetical protein
MRDPLLMAASTGSGADSAAELEALSAAVGVLEPVPPNERRGVQREEAALLLDGLLVRVARGRGAIDLALGDGLASLAVGDRLLRLGFSGLGDYARERLGVAASTAEKLARLARNLAERPLLRQAVHSGAVSPRKAETIVALAHGDQEAAWVARARGETVRSLAAQVKGALGAEAEEEPWERVAFSGRTGEHQKLGEALELAGKVLGATAPKWRRLEALCEEYLGAHPEEPSTGSAGPDGRLFDHAPSGRRLEEVEAWLEQESRRWAFISSFDPAPRPEPGSGPTPPDPADSEPVLDLARLDADLRRLRDLRARWDDLLGQLALLLRQLGLWRDLQFASLGHYCAERLGLSERAVSQRASLERRFYELPALRTALREGRVTYEKARIVAAHADERTLGAWIDRAGRLSCVALARQAEAEEEAQTCAQGGHSFRLPARVVPLLEAALRAARAAAGRFLRPGEALVLIAEHFIATWKPLLQERNTLQKRVLARDRGWCQVPGCSRAALHVHHVRFRSHGGPDTPANLVSLCAAHHLHGVHAGWIQVVGAAPHRLRWSLGVAA